MNHKTVLKLSPIAASLMIALGSSMAYAAAPAAGVLPGAFNTNVTTASYASTASNAATINLGTGANPVLQWGGSTVAVPNAVSAPSGITTVSGFNIGSGASLTVTAAAATPVLLSDLTGQASQVFGSLNAGGNTVFLANPNGVVVGGSGSVTAAKVALLGYAQDPSTFNGSVSVNTATVTNKGDVTVAKGANFNNAGYLLVAGAGNVNVDAAAVNTATSTAVGIAAGVGANAGTGVTVAPTAAYTTTAVVNLSGTGDLSKAQFGAAGAVNVASGSTVTLGNATTAIGGTLTNNGTLNLESVGTIGGALVNTNSLTTTLGTITALGGITNSGIFSNAGAMALATGTAAPAAISNSGQLSANGLTVTSASSFANTGVIYEGGNGVTATAAAINLGGVVGNSSTGGSIGALSLTASKTDITLGAKINSTGAAGVNLSAAKGSVYLNNALTATGGVTAAAANQIMVNGAVNASTGNVSLTTTNTWTGPYSLGVVVQPSGSITATGAVGITVDSTNSVGNMLQYGNITAGGAGFTYTGNSYYQGAGAQIKGAATFKFGGVLTGGIANGGQSSDPFKNAVVVNGGTTSTVTLTPTNLGVSKQNVNIMGVGNTTISANLGTLSPITSGATAVINPNFVSSNFFARAQGGSLTLSDNAGTPASSFYWPGLIYASTVQAGKLATVDTTQSISVGAGATSDPISNAVPMNVAGGMGVYLMSGKVPVNVTTNTNSNISVVNPTLSGVTGNTAAKPVGNTITFNQPLPAANLVAYTPPAE